MREYTKTVFLFISFTVSSVILLLKMACMVALLLPLKGKVLEITLVNLRQITSKPPSYIVHRIKNAALLMLNDIAKPDIVKCKVY